MPDIPERIGEQPKTHYGLPHEQLDQNSLAEIYKMQKHSWLVTSLPMCTLPTMAVCI